MNQITVGQLIRHLRTKKNLSMVELAFQLEISQPSVSRIENGTIEITLSQFEKVCCIFDLTPAQFFNLLNQQVDTQLDDYIGEKKDLTTELHVLIDQLSSEQKKGLYVFLQPYKK